MRYAIGAAGGTGEWVVREPRVPRGGCGERTVQSRRQDPLRTHAQDDRVDIE